VADTHELVLAQLAQFIAQLLAERTLRVDEFLLLGLHLGENGFALVGRRPLELVHQGLAIGDQSIALRAELVDQLLDIRRRPARSPIC